MRLVILLLRLSTDLFTVSSIKWFAGKGPLVFNWILNWVIVFKIDQFYFIQDRSLIWLRQLWNIRIFFNIHIIQVGFSNLLIYKIFDLVSISILFIWWIWIALWNFLKFESTCTFIRNKLILDEIAIGEQFCFFVDIDIWSQLYFGCPTTSSRFRLPDNLFEIQYVFSWIIYLNSINLLDLSVLSFQDRCYLNMWRIIWQNIIITVILLLSIKSISHFLMFLLL